MGDARDLAARVESPPLATQGTGNDGEDGELVVDQTHREAGKQGGGVLGSFVIMPMGHPAHKQRSVWGASVGAAEGEGREEEINAPARRVVVGRELQHGGQDSEEQNRERF